MVWSINGMKTLAEIGPYSYTFLFPLPAKFHTVSVLNISLFYLVTFLVTKPREPVKNFSISASLIFLSNTFYELMYGIFLDWRSLMITFPLVLGGIILLILLNRRFHFLTNDKHRLFLFLLCLLALVAVMFTLDRAGFFAEMQLYLGGRITKDPHTPLWILSKTLSMWMFFPILRSVST